MFKSVNNKMLVTRGDAGNINLKIPINEEKTEFYKFQVGDRIRFGVYEEEGLEKPAKILKEVEISSITDTCKIPLTSDETKIDEIQNDEVEYWYEIQLNDKETVLGFDDNGPKKFILYPEGSDKK